MIKALFSVVISVFLFSCTSTNRPGGSYQVLINPEKGEAFEKVEYRLWIPDGIDQVRGIIFRQHGCGEGARKNGLEHADDIQWQALAAKHHFALLGSQMWALKEDCTTWMMPKDGSARAFLSALDHFAKVTERPEVSKVPWALWGHSGGAIWSTNMCYTYPERIIAAFPRSGALSPTGKEWPRTQPFKEDANPKALEVPILFCYGDEEALPNQRFFSLIKGVTDLVDYGRKNGAPWAQAIHPKSNHENSNSRLLAVRFFDAVIPQRLKSDSHELRKLDLNKGYVGSNGNLTIAPFKVKDKADADLNWFASKELAQAWLELTKTGNITDKSAPPAPTHFQLADNTLSWQAAADVESSIAYFEILKNSKVIGKVGGKKAKRWNDNAHFHAWNYSDQPLTKKLPEMKFDLTAFDQSAKYSIRTVNFSGLRSSETVLK
ncbi:MAG: alpha/beta hydrolase [Lentisphaeraceae bacterium]|nr:alpha/beta hydrolase [Lentisphaeraceae bacterium]